MRFDRVLRRLGIPGIVAIACVVALFSPLRASACSCANPDLEAEFASANLIFVGSIESFEALQEVKIRVSEMIKGQLVSLVSVPVGISDCDYFLPPLKPALGERFLIIAHGEPGHWSISRCSRSAPEAEAIETLERLRRLASASRP